MLTQASYPIPATFDQASSEELIVSFVDHVRANAGETSLLIPLLAEQHPLYSGKGANQIERIRGYILASFEHPDLPECVLPYVLDALQNSRNPYLVASAAKALRGIQNASPKVISCLLNAITNIRYDDDNITFDAYKPGVNSNHTTSALREIFITFQRLGPQARDAVDPLSQLIDKKSIPFNAAIKKEIRKTISVILNGPHKPENACCGQSVDMPLTRNVTSTPGFETIADILIEDQDGNKQTVGEFFKDVPSVVTFFYTRCNNPNKCSLSISKLAQLQRQLSAGGLSDTLRTAAFTYDPGYDSAARLKLYGAGRGIQFDSNNRIFRTEKEDLARLQEYFDLGVNYSGSIVNHHRIELYILGKNGDVARAFTRLQWEVGDVMQAAQEELNKVQVNGIVRQGLGGKSGLLTLLTSNKSIILPILIAFFPKCPFCWAAYLSLIGITGMHAVPYSPWLLPVLVGMMLVNLYVLARAAKTRNGFGPVYLSLLGMVMLIIFGVFSLNKPFMYSGIFLIYLGSLLNSLSPRHYLSIRKYAMPFRIMPT